MIRYTLRCDKDHSFESWFASAEAFDGLLAKGLVSCTICGSSRVEKALMAPAVRPARKAAAAEPKKPEADAPLAHPPQPDPETLESLEEEMAKLLGRPPRP